MISAEFFHKNQKSASKDSTNAHIVNERQPDRPSEDLKVKGKMVRIMPMVMQLGRLEYVVSSLVVVVSRTRLRWLFLLMFKNNEARIRHLQLGCGRQQDQAEMALLTDVQNNEANGTENADVTQDYNGEEQIDSERNYPISLADDCKDVLHKDLIRAVRFSEKGNLLVSAGDDKLVKIWSIETWKCLATMNVWSVLKHTWQR